MFVVVRGSVAPGASGFFKKYNPFWLGGVWKIANRLVRAGEPASVNGRAAWTFRGEPPPCRASFGAAHGDTFSDAPSRLLATMRRWACWLRGVVRPLGWGAAPHDRAMSLGHRLGGLCARPDHRPAQPMAPAAAFYGAILAGSAPGQVMPAGIAIQGGGEPAEPPPKAAGRNHPPSLPFIGPYCPPFFVRAYDLRARCALGWKLHSFCMFSEWSRHSCVGCALGFSSC